MVFGECCCQAVVTFTGDSLSASNFDNRTFQHVVGTAVSVSPDDVVVVSVANHASLARLSRRAATSVSLDITFDVIAQAAEVRLGPNSVLGVGTVCCIGGNSGVMLLARRNRSSRASRPAVPRSGRSMPPTSRRLYPSNPTSLRPRRRRHPVRQDVDLSLPQPYTLFACGVCSLSVSLSVSLCHSLSL